MNNYNFNSVRQRLNKIDDSLIIKWADCHNMSDPTHTNWTEKQVAEVTDFFSHYNIGIDMNKPMFTTTGTAEILQKTKSRIQNTLQLFPELKPHTKDGRAFKWSIWEINRLSVKTTGKDISLADVNKAIGSRTVPDLAAECGNTLTEYIDDLLTVNSRVMHDFDLRWYISIQNNFERYNEKDLSIIFGELLRRFKFSYIVENVDGCQTQTLTAIKQGSLAGLDIFKLSFDVYLGLIKFAKENNCPLHFVKK